MGYDDVSRYDLDNAISNVEGKIRDEEYERERAVQDARNDAERALSALRSDTDMRFDDLWNAVRALQDAMEGGEGR